MVISASSTLGCRMAVVLTLVVSPSGKNGVISMRVITGLRCFMCIRHLLQVWVHRLLLQEWFLRSVSDPTFQPLQQWAGETHRSTLPDRLCQPPSREFAHQRKLLFKRA